MRSHLPTLGSFLLLFGLGVHLPLGLVVHFGIVHFLPPWQDFVRPAMELVAELELEFVVELVLELVMEAVWLIVIEASGFFLMGPPS